MGRGSAKKRGLLGGTPPARRAASVSFYEEALEKARISLFSKISPDLGSDERRAAAEILYPTVRANPGGEEISIELWKIKISMEGWLEETIDYCEEEGGSYMVDSVFGEFFLSEKDFERFSSLAKDESPIEDQYKSWLQENFSVELALEDYFGRKRKEGEDAEWDSARVDIENASEDLDIDNDDLWECVEKRGFRTFQEWRYDDGEGSFPSLDFVRENAKIDPQGFIDKVFAAEAGNLEIIPGDVEVSP